MRYIWSDPGKCTVFDTKTVYIILINAYLFFVTTTNNKTQKKNRMFMIP
jgi:hypothetical protein